MPQLNSTVFRHVWENLSVLFCCAYSRRPLLQQNGEFSPSWNRAQQTLLGLADARADRAVLDLAIYLQSLTSPRSIADRLRAQKVDDDCGLLVKHNGREERLRLRDVAAKIMEADHRRWNWSKESTPILVCVPPQEESATKNAKWLRAEVNLHQLAAICSVLTMAG